MDAADKPFVTTEPLEMTFSPSPSVLLLKILIPFKVTAAEVVEELLSMDTPPPLPSAVRLLVSTMPLDVIYKPLS